MFNKRSIGLIINFSGLEKFLYNFWLLFIFSESYFSPYYLSKDHSIVRFMDSEGWLPLIFLSGFPRVQEFTHDLRLIDQIVRNSKILELSPDGLKVFFALIILWATLNGRGLKFLKIFC